MEVLRDYSIEFLSFTNKLMKLMLLRNVPFFSLLDLANKMLSFMTLESS